MTASIAAGGIAAVGDVLAGKYRVEKILGIGGMGMVVAATHLELDQRVALKFMLPGAAEQPEAAARFLREARAAGRLNSDHVCRMVDLGRFETGAPYIVMEYLQGESLAAQLKRRGPLRVAEAVDYILQAIEGLAEAHAHGIVHRDLKPDNLFLHQRNDGGTILKVLDFGISKISLHDLSTRTGDIMGSPAYMAPEQMESTRNVDQRADVWSLGVVLYQLVTGKPPFHGETLPLLCMHVVNDDPAPMSAIRGDLPAGFEPAVMTCLRKNPAERYADVGQLAHAIAPFGPKHASTSASRIQIVLRRATGSEMAVGESGHLATRPVAGPTHGALAATSGPAPGPDRGERRSWGVIGAVLAGLAIGGAVVGMLWRSGWVGDARLSEPAAVALPDPAAAPGAEAARPPRPIVEPIVEPAAAVTAAGAPVPGQPAGASSSTAGSPVAGGAGQPVAAGAASSPVAGGAGQPVAGGAAGAPVAVEAAGQPVAGGAAGSPMAGGAAGSPMAGGAAAAPVAGGAAGSPSVAGSTALSAPAAPGSPQPSSARSPAGAAEPSSATAAVQPSIAPAKQAVTPPRRRKPRGRAPAPHGAASTAAGSGAGSAQGDDDDKWMHMTHDESRP